MKVTIVSCKRTALFGCSNFNSTIYWGSFLTKEIFTFFVFFFVSILGLSGQPMINWQRCLGGTDLRSIQSLLGHESSKTTEICTNYDYGI